MRIVMRFLHKRFPNTYKFCASQHGVNYFLSAPSTITVRFGQTSLKFRRMILLNICEFRENWQSESYNFLMAVNEIPLRVCRETVRYLRANRVSWFTQRTICNIAT